MFDFNIEWKKPRELTAIEKGLKHSALGETIAWLNAKAIGERTGANQTSEYIRKEYTRVYGPDTGIQLKESNYERCKNQ